MHGVALRDPGWLLKCCRDVGVEKWLGGVSTKVLRGGFRERKKFRGVMTVCDAILYGLRASTYI